MVLRTYGGSKRQPQSTSEPKREREPELTVRRKKRRVNEDVELEKSPLVLLPTSERRQPGLVRDLTQIFDEATTPSPKKEKAKSWSQSPSPTKLSQRMLGRSKTEPSLSQQSAVSLEDAGSLHPVAGPSKSPVIQPFHIDEEPSALPQLVRRSTKRTYAGPSRSFLVAIPVQPDSQLDTIDAEQQPQRESYASIRKRWNVDNTVDEITHDLGLLPKRTKSVSKSQGNTPDVSPAKRKGKVKETADAAPSEPLGDGMMNPLKTITELRSKGEARKFMDDVGYLLEGLGEDNTIGLRRASALEIITKLCDPTFLRRARAADFIGRTWDLLLEGRTEDKILNVLQALLSCIASTDETLLSELIARLSFIPRLFHLLELSHDILLMELKPDREWKQLGLGKKEKGLVAQILSVIRDKSGLFDECQAITTPLLLTTVLTALSPELLPCESFPSVLNVLRSTVKPFISQMKLSPSIRPIATTRRTGLEILAEGEEESDLTELSDRSTPPPPPPPSVLGKRKIKVHRLVSDVDEDSDDEDKKNINLTKGKTVTELAMNLLKLVDSYLLGRWARSEQWSDIPDEDVWIVDGLAFLGQSEPKLSDISLRILVALSHSRESWALRLLQNTPAMAWVGGIVAECDTSRQRSITKVSVKKEDGDEGGKTEAEEEEVEEKAKTLDRLCLALALLTNLVQGSSEAGGVFMKTAIQRSPSEEITLLDVLVTVYKNHSPVSPGPVKSEPGKDDDKQSPDDDDADSAFLRAHLSVLFGMVMMRSSPNAKDQDLTAHLLDLLPLPPASTSEDRKPHTDADVDVSRAKVGALLHEARKFVSFYRIAMAYDARMNGHARSSSSSSAGAGAGEGRRGFVDAEGSESARDVVGFLEGLDGRLG